MSCDFDSANLHLSYHTALIVGDDLRTTERLQKVLEFWECSAIVVDSGADALELATRLRPELVICDLELRDFDCCSFATNLRQNPRFDGVRLVALSADGNDEHRREALRAGFDLCLTKPVTLEEFFTHINDVTPAGSLLAVDETFRHVRRPVLVS